MKHANNRPDHAVPRIGVSIAAVVVSSSLVFAATSWADRGLNKSPETQGVSAAAVQGFSPGMIISDKLFYNPSTMDAAAIQDFSDAQGRSCASDATIIVETLLADPNTPKSSDGTTPQPQTQTKRVAIPCLKDSVRNIPGRPTDNYYPGVY